MVVLSHKQVLQSKKFRGRRLSQGWRDMHPTECLGSTSTSSTPNSSFLLTSSWEIASNDPSNWVLATHMWDKRFSSPVPTWAWHNPGYCGHSGSKSEQNCTLTSSFSPLLLSPSLLLKWLFLKERNSEFWLENNNKKIVRRKICFKAHWNQG